MRKSFKLLKHKNILYLIRAFIKHISFNLKCNLYENSILAKSYIFYSKF